MLPMLAGNVPDSWLSAKSRVLRFNRQPMSFCCRLIPLVRPIKATGAVGNNENVVSNASRDCATQPAIQRIKIRTGEPTLPSMR